jgi:hypothetical protein
MVQRISSRCSMSSDKTHIVCDAMCKPVYGIVHTGMCASTQLQAAQSDNSLNRIQHYDVSAALPT